MAEHDEHVFRVPASLLERAFWFFVVPFGLGDLLRFLRTGNVKSFAISVAILFLLGIALLRFISWLLAVRVSPVGLRGAFGKPLRWSDIERTSPPSSMAFLGGFLAQSAHKPSIHIPAVIATDPAFARLVQQYVSAEHPVAHALDLGLTATPAR